MVAEGRWVPMKRTALALHQLISTRFRGDDLSLITFGRHAQTVELGEAFFDYPPSPHTLRATVDGLDRLIGMDARFTFFVLGDDPGLAAFMDRLARRSGGRVVNPDLDGLGAEVVSDYLRKRAP